MEAPPPIKSFDIVRNIHPYKKNSNIYSPPWFGAVQTVDRETSREALRALVHAVLFHRLFGVVAPMTLDVLDVALPAVRDPPTERIVDRTVDAFLRALAALQQPSRLGTIELVFSEKRTKRAGWFYTGEVRFLLISFVSFLPLPPYIHLTRTDGYVGRDTVGNLADPHHTPPADERGRPGESARAAVEHPRPRAHGHCPVYRERAGPRRRSAHLERRGHLPLSLGDQVESQRRGSRFLLSWVAGWGSV